MGLDPRRRWGPGFVLASMDVVDLFIPHHFPAPPSCQTGRGEAGGDRAREPGLCLVGATATDMDKGPQSRAQSPQMSAVAEISLTTT